MSRQQPASDRSFMELVDVHRTLDRVFLAHQSALICMQGAAAERTYAAYKELLALHIHHEDEILLPVFRRIGPIQRWPDTLFSGEHRKLEGFLARIDAGLAALGEPTPDKAAAIVGVIDIEGGLKRLQEHHDDREQQCLFPVLDQVTEADERAALLDRVLGEFARAHARLLPEWA